MNPFQIENPTGKRLPILVSVPHCGIQFPDELQDLYEPQLAAAPDDTDWLVDRLYDFAPKMGITLIKAVYSRWVIDLNRTPDSLPLYDDGRIITALCPVTSFAGENIYKEGYQPNQNEIERRLELYYWPYYAQIQRLLDELKTEFGQVLFWDAHSIRQHVPLIRKDNFPDLILGDNDGQSASPKLIETALKNLQLSNLQLQHNTPFKGGHLTRYFGKPDNGQHALQLEMTKVNYMDDSERHYHPERATKMSAVLQQGFNNLATVLKNMG